MNKPKTSQLKPGTLLGTEEKTVWRWLVPAVIVFGLIFCGFTYLNSGGPRGFYLKHKPFTGANSKELAAGRAKITTALQSLDQRLGDQSDLRAVLVTPLQKIDWCVKGQHSLPIAGATEDNYAYWCAVESRQYYAYAQAPCEIAAALAKQRISFDVQQDCTTTVADLQQNASSYRWYGDKPDVEITVSIDTRDNFVSNAQRDLDSSYPMLIGNCASGVGRPAVYCKDQNVSLRDERAAVASLPATSQTIITTMLWQATYYQK